MSAAGKTRQIDAPTASLPAAARRWGRAGDTGPAHALFSGKTAMTHPASTRGEVIRDLGCVGAAEWDACAGGANPFARHAFLRLLESSGSVCEATGFSPHHIVLKEADGRLLAAAPMYVKRHSDGEFLSQEAWARAFEAHGGRYHPKLAMGVPFFPVPGSRLMRRGDAPPGLSAAMMELIQGVVRHHGWSSAHAYFTDEGDRRLFSAAGWLQLIDVQYRWENQGYASFDEFLATLRSKRSSAIRMERRSVGESGIDVRVLVDDAISESNWESFYRLYVRAYRARNNHPFLTLDFFKRLGEALHGGVMLVMAEEGGHCVAGALNLIVGDRLYLRIWSAIETRRFLVFELTLYRTIEYAIRNGLRVIEGGAGGGYKRDRGFRPVLTHSFHWSPKGDFQDALAVGLREQNAAVSAWFEKERARSPYK